MSRDALVVGINRYADGSLSDLAAPSVDAEAIAQILERDGDFRVTRLPGVGHKPSATVRMPAKKDIPVSQKQLKKALVQLFKPNGNPPDTALLYFSGHGLRDDLGISEGFLATSDANPDGGNWGLSLQWLRRLLQESDVRQQIIILDCCHSGEVLDVGEADPGERGNGRDRCFIAASRPFEIAYEAIGSPHSVLTAALLQGLEPQADRWVTNYTLIESLDRFSHNFPQRPIFANSGEPINLTRRWQTAEIPQPSSTTTICPYKGLEYFDCTAADARFFYGRTALTDQLLEKVRSGNFLAVLGPSGSGKSSVVRAGLLYQLMLGRRLSGSEAWHIRIFRPGEHPLQNLAQVFVGSPVGDETNPFPSFGGEFSQIDRASQLDRAETLLKKGADGLRQLVLAAETPRVVLVVDQFEEAFTLCRDTEERERFFACLLEALAQVGEKLCLVLAMRADFFGQYAEREYSGLAEAIQENLVTVTPMNREQLQRAIVKPAEEVGVAVEPELVERAIEEVEGSPGSLPLLQYALRELWHECPEAGLMLAAYTRLGGVKGTLEKRATAVYEALSEAEQGVAKHIFLALTQLGEGTEDTRRPVRMSELVTSRHPQAKVETVIQKLADERLIVTRKADRERGSGAIVDVAHETLIRSWRQLRRWLDESRETLRQTRKIEQAAAEWEERRKAKDYLLQGRRLREARELRQDVALSRLAVGFIDVSIRQKRIDWLKLVGGVVVIPIIGTIVAGVAITRELQLYGYRQTIDDCRGIEKKCPGRITALEKLHQAEREIGNFNLENAYLEKIRLPQANLGGADLRGANLGRANLGGANLWGADLGEAYLGGADLGEANLWGASLEEASLEEANLRRADLGGASLEEANLRRADLGGADLQEADLREADLWGADLGGADLGGADLQEADLQEADLRRADFGEADLGGASLEEANLGGADFGEADLGGADLRGANFTESEHFGKVKNLTPAQVKSACYWEEAKFDPEFQAELDEYPDPETEVDCSRWER